MTVQQTAPDVPEDYVAHLFDIGEGWRLSPVVAAAWVRPSRPVSPRRVPGWS